MPKPRWLRVNITDLRDSAIAVKEVDCCSDVCDGLRLRFHSTTRHCIFITG
ncbi:MAG: hypothetical protein V7K69_02780 [Nostoc sp.]